jgi:hypothetical protein
MKIYLSINKAVGIVRLRTNATEFFFNQVENIGCESGIFLFGL